MDRIVTIRRRDGITQRYRVAVKVKKYKRKVPGKKTKYIKVKPYEREMRELGGKIHYKKVGIFEVAHDDAGNFRGSKVIPLPKKK